MSALNLLKLEKIALLKLGSVDYIAVVETPDDPFTHQPSNTAVSPLVYLAVMTDDETVTIDPTDYIMDSNSPVITYQKVVGPRPKNIARR